MRDTVKTMAGLIIIGVIVVATFLYGNAQRQAQLRHDQEVKNQQQSKAAGNEVAKALPSASAKPTTSAVPSASAKPSASAAPKSSTATANNTAPVQSPSQNSIQGSKAATPSTSGMVASAATVPTTGPGADPLPTTGSPLSGLVGVAAVIGAAVALRWSKRSLVAAARR